MKFCTFNAFCYIFNSLINHIAYSVSLSIRVCRNYDIFSFAIIKYCIYSVFGIFFEIKYWLIVLKINYYLICKLFKMPFCSINFCSSYLLYLIDLVWTFNYDYCILHVLLLFMGLHIRHEMFYTFHMLFLHLALLLLSLRRYLLSNLHLLLYLH